MKNLKILSLALLSLFIISCDPDDDNGPELNNANLAGTYNVTAFSATGSSTDVFNGMTSTETFDAVGSAFNNVTFTFTESGMVTTTGTFTITTVYVEDGLSETEVDTTDIDLNGTYTLSGNTILFSDSDGETVTIRNFSNNGLELFFEINEVDGGDTYQAEGTYTLVRQ